jgi:2-C-methyl-D-erythritol 4-phosphate cytidylyltransferase
MILAAGGVGSRMGASIPKQYLFLSDKPIALHSFELFCQMEEFDEIIVVCEPQFRSLFSYADKPIFFADPGKRRQDSIFSGFCAASKRASIVCTHDSARPFVEKKEILALLDQALEFGAATLGAPVLSTIKKCRSNRIAEATLDRSSLWEIQTPQALRYDLMKRGFGLAADRNIDVTDDTSLAELIGAPVVVVPSPHSNFKITTPTDMAVATIHALQKKKSASGETPDPASSHQALESPCATN